MIILETNMGEIHITVDAEKAPITAKNFTDYVEEGFFDGTIFHRVIPNFSNLYQEEIYYFERSYNFEESLYLLLKN